MECVSSNREDNGKAKDRERRYKMSDLVGTGRKVVAQMGELMIGKGGIKLVIQLVQVGRL